MHQTSQPRAKGIYQKELLRPFVSLLHLGRGCDQNVSATYQVYFSDGPVQFLSLLHLGRGCASNTPAMCKGYLSDGPAQIVYSLL